MRTRIYNARILTMEEKRPVFKGEIYIDGGKIFRIKEAKTEKSERTEKPALNEEEKWDEEIDAEGNLIMPGFKNAHTHSAMTFLRSYADDMKLQEWLFDKVFPAEAKLTSDDVYHLTKLAILEYLTSGITAAFDMYKLKQDSAKAAEELGFRMVFCGDINDFGGTLEEMEQDYFRYQCEETPLLSYQFGFHAEYTTKMELMKEIADLAHKYKSPVFLHNSETQNEVKECLERYGKTPTQLTEELGMYEYGGGGYHCVYFDDKDFEIFKKRQLTAVTCPASNLKLASGIAPLKRFVEEGIPVAIGTDGPASNNSLDMFKEMFLASALAKVREMDAECISADKILYMATTGGAHAMGLDNCDRLAAGKKADLIMIDLQQPNMQPENNIVKNLVYSGSKQNVKLTMVNGKILYEDQKFSIGFEPADIYKEANRIIRSMEG